MKAWLSRISGPVRDLELAEVSAPVAAPDQVVVSVEACALNHPDLLMIADQYQYRPPRPFSPGCEIAGTVTALGVGVTGLEIGQPVAAVVDYGGLAQQVAVDSSKLLHLPADADLAKAAALPLSYGTALHALQDRGRLAFGDTVLVLGAAGGTGLAAIQLTKALNGTAIALVSSKQKARVAKAAGADQVVVYDRQGVEPRALAEALKAATAPGGADIIFDPVGGTMTGAAIRAMAWDGRYLVVGFTAGIPELPLNLLLMKRCAAIGVFWGPFVDRFPAVAAEQREMLLRLWREHLIDPVIATTFSFADTPRALELLATGTSAGRIIVRISKET